MFFLTSFEDSPREEKGAITKVIEGGDDFESAKSKFGYCSALNALFRPLKAGESRKQVVNTCVSNLAKWGISLDSPKVALLLSNARQ